MQAACSPLPPADWDAYVGEHAHASAFHAAAAVLVGQQAFINVAVNLNMIPTKGMTLPFISYGGSSLLAMGLTLGMGLALIRKRPGAYGDLDGPAKAGAFS